MAKSILKENNSEEINDRKEEHKTYLNSERWQKIRQKRLWLDNFSCVDCAQPATEVHHTDYDFLETEREIEFTMSLCRNCHRKRGQFYLSQTRKIGTPCTYCTQHAVMIIGKKHLCRYHIDLKVKGEL